MRTRPESSIILLIFLIGIILAIGAFLAISILLERPGADELAAVPPTPLPFTVNVEGQDITLQIDPAAQPVIIEPTAVPPQPEAAQSQEATPTPTPEPAAQPQSDGGSGGQAQAQPAANRLTFIDYVVQGGDTLYSIQSKHTTSIALMAKHGIDAWDIVVGNVLRLPVGNSAACNGWQAYVVLKGDTSFGLSQWYGISLQEFGSWNGLDANYSIYETDIVCVPY